MAGVERESGEGGRMKLSYERLVHFQCDHCQKWWSIGDAPDQSAWNCPWCCKLNQVEGEVEKERESEGHLLLIELGRRKEQWERMSDTRDWDASTEANARLSEISSIIDFLAALRRNQ